MTLFRFSSRRQFVVSVGTLFGMALLPGCGPSRETRELGSRLIAMLTTTDLWRRVGESYLKLHPGERRLDQLNARLVEDLRWDPLTGADADLATLVARRVRSDFRQGRTVLVDGWVLSETEARLAAVASLV